MVKRQVKEIDEKEIARYKGYLSDNKTLSEIGLLEGVSKQAISERLKKMGLTPTKTKLTKSQLDIKSQVNYDGRALKQTGFEPLGLPAMGGGHITADLGSRHNHPSAGNDGMPLPEPQEITESYAEQFLIRCAQSNPGDPKVAALLIQWLDKKKALEPKINDGTALQQQAEREYYDEVLKNVYK